MSLSTEQDTTCEMDQRSKQETSSDDTPISQCNNTNQSKTKTAFPTNRTYSSRMTPSIINTINNTSPTPQDYDKLNQHLNSQEQSNNNNQLQSIRTRTGKRQNTEPVYESYIEDSFVGHWEHEDDDIDEDFHNNDHGDDDSDSILHSSTIEFDFDSFGPESIVYTANTPATNQTNLTTITIKQGPESDDKVPSKIDEPTVNNNDATTSITSIDIEARPSQHPDGSVKPQQLKQQNDNKLCLSTNEAERESQDRIGPSNDQDGQLESNRDDAIERVQTPTTYNRQQLNLTRNISQPIDETQIDLKVIEPYKKVISHAGYCHFFDPSNPQQIQANETAPAVIVFSACYLPDRSRRDYDYVMDHLFLYVLTSLHELIADDYILIYLHNTQPPTATNRTNPGSSSDTSSSNLNNLPSFTWIKRCYQLIGRKLRKNLRVLYLVKPTFWLKTIVIMCKPFISSKFSRKINFIEDMEGLRKCLPVDKLILPASAENL